MEADLSYFYLMCWFSKSSTPKGHFVLEWARITIFGKSWLNELRTESKLTYWIKAQFKMTPKEEFSIDSQFFESWIVPALALCPKHQTRTEYMKSWLSSVRSSDHLKSVSTVFVDHGGDLALTRRLGRLQGNHGHLQGNILHILFPLLCTLQSPLTP